MGLEDKRVIGISWKSFNGSNMEKKVMTLKDFGKCSKDLDIVLLNLQYGDVHEEIDEFTQATGIEILQCGSVDNREDLDGLAALIELCDLVVSTRNVTDTFSRCTRERDLGFIAICSIFLVVIRSHR